MTPSDQTELRQKLAAIEHERWSDWQKWCHKVLRENCPAAELEKVLQRWDKQIDTPYSLLTAAEQASDMEQVDRYWPLIEAYVASAEQRAELQGHRTTSTVLQYVIEAHSGFEGDNKAAARHWKKQTDKLIAELEQSLQKEQE